MNSEMQAEALLEEALDREFWERLKRPSSGRSKTTDSERNKGCTDAKSNISITTRDTSRRV